MALKLTQRLQLLRQAGAAHAYLAFGLRRISGHRVSAGCTGQKCVASSCLWTRPFGSCRFQRHCCLELQQHGCGYDRGVSTIVREPSFLTTSSVGLHRDPGLRFRLTVLHRPTDAEFLAFRERLANCVSSRQVFRLMGTVEILSDTMGAAALHRVADLEASDSSLKNPAVLEHDAVRTLCFQLEQDSGRLTDEGLVSALLACTRLYLDPWSTLVVRLVSESQERLDAGRMSVGQLCTLGRAMLALEGPGCGMLEQVMEQVQRRTPVEWSLDDLMAVYGLLQGGLGECGHYQKLLNRMNARAMSATSSMDPAAVSGLLDALVVLDQTQAMPLVINLCKQAVKHVPHFSDDELTAVLGALMHFGHSDYHFVAAMERHVPKMAFTSHAETVTQVMQYFGQRNILSVPVFDAVAESFVYRADEYTTGQLAGQIIPFGKLGYLPPNAGQMFRKVEANLHARFSQFQPRMLLNLLHACILVQRFPVNFVSKVFSSYFLQQLQEEGAGIDRINLAQLTQLYMTVKLECPSYDGPRLLSKYRVKTFLLMGRSLETPVDGHLYHCVKNGLVHLLGARSYFASSVLTPYCYTIDVEIKLDEEGFVQPASYNEGVYKRIALCIDGQRRFTTNTRQLLGMEAIKQRHLRLLGYEVVQIPFFEFEKLQSQTDIIEYLHKKIFPQSYRLSW